MPFPAQVLAAAVAMVLIIAAFFAAGLVSGGATVYLLMRAKQRQSPQANTSAEMSSTEDESSNGRPLAPIIDFKEASDRIRKRKRQETVLMGTPWLRFPAQPSLDLDLGVTEDEHGHPPSVSLLYPEPINLDERRHNNQQGA